MNVKQTHLDALQALGYTETEPAEPIFRSRTIPREIERVVFTIDFDPQFQRSRPRLDSVSQPPGVEAASGTICGVSASV